MIEYSCPSCGTSFKSPKAHAGRQGKCRTCNTVITIPHPEQMASVPVERKACPFCAEMIQPNAIKCRYCGSDLVSNISRSPVGNAERVGAKHAAPSPATYDLAESKNPMSSSKERGDPASRAVPAGCAALHVTVGPCTLGLLDADYGAVEVDGKRIEGTPKAGFTCHFEVRPGEHLLRTEAAGQRKGKFRINVPSTGQYHVHLGTGAMAGTFWRPKKLKLRPMKPGEPVPEPQRSVSDSIAKLLVAFLVAVVLLCGAGYIAQAVSHANAVRAAADLRESRVESIAQRCVSLSEENWEIVKQFNTVASASGLERSLSSITSGEKVSKPQDPELVDLWEKTIKPMGFDVGPLTDEQFDVFRDGVLRAGARRN